MSTTRRKQPALAPRLIIGVGLAVGVGVAGYALRSALALRERVEALGLPHAAVLAWLGAAIIAQLVALYSVWRGAVGSWRTVRRSFCLLVATWLSTLIWLQPIDQLAVEITLGAAAGVLGASIALTRTNAGSTTPRGLRIVEWIVFQICLTAVLTELLLALLAQLSPSPILMVESPSIHRSLTALARPPGRPHMGFPTNSSGHYDIEFRSRAERSGKTIAMVGDSFSASFVPHRYHFTTVAERALGDVEIYNFGVPGIGPEEYRYLLRKQVLQFEPDAVLIGVFAGNDLQNVRVGRRGDRWLWPWFDRRQVRLVSVPSRLLKLANERARGGAMSPAQAAAGSAARLLGSEAELVRAYPWLHDHHLEHGTFSQPAYLELARERIAAACNPSPDRLAVLFECIDDMRAATGSERPFGVVLLPTEFQVEPELWRRATIGIDASQLDRDQPQAAITKGLAARGIACLDLLPVMRAEPLREDGERHLYLLRDTHFNVRGNAVAGREIAAFARRLLADPGK